MYRKGIRKKQKTKMYQIWREAKKKRGRGGRKKTPKKIEKKCTRS